ncbi:MAG: hypothetical protein LC772_10920 [Chloroflexi bacterium]|nr:hypothetical protein [Chloroflexota bacterium]
MSANLRPAVIAATSLGLALALWSNRATAAPVDRLHAYAPSRYDSVLFRGFPKSILSRMPILFERNQGQTASRVRFLSRAPARRIPVTGTRAAAAWGSFVSRSGGEMETR